MKFRWIITKYVEADNIEEAIRKDKRTAPHDVGIHNAWWEKQDLKLKEEVNSKRIGFSQKKGKL